MGAVYDLCVAPPHQPEGTRYTREQWGFYVAGYNCALTMALRVMELAVVAFKLRVKTLQLEARRRKEP